MALNADDDRLGRQVARGLLRQAGVYGISALVGRSIPFLLLPILTRFLSPTDFGILTMFLFVVVALEPLVDLNFSGSLMVAHFEATVDKSRYLGTGLILVACSTAAWAMLALLGHGPLTMVTGVPAPWLALAALLAGARGVLSIWLVMLRVRGMAVPFGLLQNAHNAILLGGSVLLVVALSLDWRGRVEAEILATCVFALVGIAWVARRGALEVALDRHYLSRIVSFGLPLVPHALGALLIAQTDRLLLTNLVGLEATGLYTVGFQLALVVQVVAIAFNQAYSPWLYRQLSEATPAVKRRLVRLTYVQFGAVAILSLAVAIGMPIFAPAILGPGFAGSTEYVGWFALAFLFNAMYFMVTNYIFFVRRTYLLAAVTSAVGVLNLPLTYVLITTNGPIGAAQATAISFGLSFVFTWAMAQRAYPMPWLGRRRKAE